MRLIDPAHPAYRPLWVRLGIVTLCFGWAGFEYAWGGTAWAYLFAAIGGYAAWMLLITWKTPGKDSE